MSETDQQAQLFPQWPDFFRSPEEGQKYADLGFVYWCERCVCWHLADGIKIEELKDTIEVDRA